MSSAHTLVLSFPYKTDEAERLLALIGLERTGDMLCQTPPLRPSEFQSCAKLLEMAWEWHRAIPYAVIRDFPSCLSISCQMSQSSLLFHSRWSYSTTILSHFNTFSRWSVISLAFPSFCTFDRTLRFCSYLTLQLRGFVKASLGDHSNLSFTTQSSSLYSWHSARHIRNNS